MVLPVLGGNNGLRQAAPDRFIGRPSESKLGLAIPGGDGSSRVHADERVVGGFDDYSVMLAGFDSGHQLAQGSPGSAFLRSVHVYTYREMSGCLVSACS